jgi:hypothetical protein
MTISAAPLQLLSHFQRPPIATELQHTNIILRIAMANSWVDGSMPKQLAGPLLACHFRTLLSEVPPAWWVPTRDFGLVTPDPSIIASNGK